MADARFALLRREWPLALGALSTALFLAFGRAWLADLSPPGWYALLLGWLFAAIAICAFGVVRHAESLAVRVGEPLGTLVLTLAMSGMELLIIAAVMVAGPGVSSLARDTMLAIVMIVLNGLVGVSLLLGGLRYHEQTYNLYGANAFLSVIVRSGPAEPHRVATGTRVLAAPRGVPDTNILQGAVHLLLFVAYLMLIFER